MRRYFHAILRHHPASRPDGARRPGLHTCVRLATGCIVVLALPLACITPPPLQPGTADSAGTAAASNTPAETMTELNAWTASSLMSPGINIGNTLENTTQWETGWGN